MTRRLSKIQNKYRYKSIYFIFFYRQRRYSIAHIATVIVVAAKVSIVASRPGYVEVVVPTLGLFKYFLKEKSRGSIVAWPFVQIRSERPERDLSQKDKD